MNKTIIININGIVFHIEEDAYNVLKAYMTDVKRHFEYTADRDEIVSDIETRIAEVFLEKLDEQKKQVIDAGDVETVKVRMGAVNEFSDGEEDAFSKTADFNADKKLFRDMDDKIIGGVCSGLAHYFNLQPRLMRIITLVVVLAGGSGLLIYIILWLVMPEAKTRSDKMAMKGEPINIQNFKKNFDEEAETIKSNFAKAGTGGRPAGHNTGSFLDSFFKFVSRFIRGLLKILVKIIGLFIIVIGSIALFASVVAFISVMGFWNSGDTQRFPFTIVNPEYQSALYFSAFVLVIIPIIALMLFALRVLFNRTVITRTGSFTMLIIWLTGLGLGIYYGARLASGFAEEASFEQSINLQSRPVYYLKLNDSKSLSSEDSIEYDLPAGRSKGRIIINSGEDDEIAPRNMWITIEPGNVPNPVLIQEYGARGANFKTALKSARRTVYRFAQLDSVLQFDKALSIPPADLWRVQTINLKLLVPENSRLIIDSKLNKYLRDYNLEDCLPDDKPYPALSEWVMTKEGLKCKNDSLYLRKHGKN